MKRMTIIRILFLLTFLFCGNISVVVDAQKAKTSQKTKTTQRKKTTTKRKTNTKKAKSKTNANASASSKTAERTPFEGEMLYVSYECQSKAIIKWSKGTAYNGERTKLVKLKGNDMDIYDRSMQYHTTIKGDSRFVYVWSEVTNKALAFDISYLLSYLNVLGPEPNPVTPTVTKTSTMKVIGTKNYKGDNLEVCKGQQKFSSGGIYDVELWYSKRYIVPPVYKYLNYGAPVDGIVKKWTYTFDSPANFLGHFYGMVSTELVSLYEHKVNDSDFHLPKDCKLKTNAKNSDLIKFYKELSKKLKKTKQYPEDNYELAKANINESWPFTEDWLKKAKNSSSATWERLQLGMNLFSTALTIASQVSGGGSSGGESGIAGDIDVPTGKDRSYYQTQYDIWKNKAINCLRSSVSHKKQGKMKGDSGYTKMGAADAKVLRTIQRHMRAIRITAQKEGFNIPQSEYETSSY